MSTPSRQIGWSNESNLLSYINKQLERLLQVLGAALKTQPTFGSISLASASYTLTTNGIYTVTTGGSNSLIFPDPTKMIGETITVINTAASTIPVNTTNAPLQRGTASTKYTTLAANSYYIFSSNGINWRGGALS